VIVLGVDSVTVDNNVVVGRESGQPIGEGPGKDGGIELIDLVEVNGHSGWIIGLSDGSSLARREGLDTDSGSSTFLAVTLCLTKARICIMLRVCQRFGLQR
jgi:hypothetical protein